MKHQGKFLIIRRHVSAGRLALVGFAIAIVAIGRFGSADKAPEVKNLAIAPDAAVLTEAGQIKRDGPEFKKLTAVSGNVETTRKEAERVSAGDPSNAETIKREAAAARIERALQSAGIDVHVTLSGIDKTEIKFEYNRFSRALIYRIQDETGLLRNLRVDGFKKAVFTDGHLYTWNYHLDNSVAGNQ